MDEQESDFEVGNSCNIVSWLWLCMVILAGPYCLNLPYFIVPVPGINYQGCGATLFR